MNVRSGILLLALGTCLLPGWLKTASARDFIAGADVSMLPEIEKAGGSYKENGQTADAIKVLRDHGCNLFRVRLFVKPSKDFNKVWGATQDLPYVRALAKRIKASGGIFLLDIHYADSWADPGKQPKPEDWNGLDYDGLVKKVHDYTASVLSDLKSDGCMPDMVQVGNEITGGIVWPDGKVLDAPDDVQDRQWKRFAELFNSGAKAVREASTPDHPIRVMIHIHGGGRDGLPKWFFGKFNANPTDYDVIGLSFYPAWDDSLDNLKKNMADVISAYGKDILVAETSYPWRDMEGMTGKPSVKWPQTKDGQAQFLRDLTAALKDAPGGHGLGYVWWYPEAVPTQGLGIWRNGAEALFDAEGNPLPAMDEYRATK